MKTTLPKIIHLILVVFCLSCQQQKHQEVANDYYQEPYRPQFHFSPEANWMNDPNGMVYYEGEYHLFYQYHPEGNTWGPMHWGHAISQDLVHWEHLPIALYPDKFGTIFSGSAVADLKNTSGLGTEENPPLIAIFTYHDAEAEKAGAIDFQTQGIAYSLDKGRTWEKYENNPVLKNPGIKDFRDPKVMWYEDNDGKGKWIMSLAVKDRISFYSSENLIDWEYESDFQPLWAAYGGVWECPDLFKVKSPDGIDKWVLFVSINPGGPNGGSATQYFVGDFDGMEFTTTEEEVKWLDYGADNYAGVTWSNVPKEDGRVLFIGWMSNWDYANVVPTEVWRSAKTIPRSLELFEIAGRSYLASKPVKELDKLKGNTLDLQGNEIELEHELLEMALVIEEADFEFELSNEAGESVTLKRIDDKIYFDRSNSGKTDFEVAFKKLHTAPDLGINFKELRVFLDKASIEFFFNEGELVLTEIIFPTQPYSKLKTKGFGDSKKVHQLKSIW
ncbi:glycoside hydrolase family 32 protein [Belliella kenyensis]|uniref:Glycoside hydrolase family 32 protein n=1 Tax=Belliella kenyensis TaxID=1472724 RepID=A0ABV8EMG8_9BACT|nr:glycoside hydrolase family 32 protein [Belliella kenyensis]MCH7400586.1 glycoside hydrolase family 32 protein [Belliella kenyensis]MDN3602127.1 glycoside hydrolase family 32 protein [Belliella kenyensis]